jgi:Right handed beta helix region
MEGDVDLKGHNSLRLVILLVGIFCAFLMISPSHAKAILVEDPQGLAQAVDSATHGDVIQLSGNGPYEIQIKGRKFSPALTIQSATAGQLAVVSKVLISETEGVTIQTLNISAVFPTVNEVEHTVKILKSADVTISDCIIAGAAKEYLTKENKKTAQASHLMLIRWSQGVSIENNTISGFFQGIGILESTRLKISHNDISSMQGDGIRMGGVENLEISENRIHDFLGSDQTLNHSDMIQLWSTNAKIVSSDIKIVRNRLLSGDGTATQAIFLRNEQADSNLTAVDRYYSNILISDNLIHNGHLHGITVGESNGLTISNNTLLPNSLSVMGDGANRRTMLPTIRVAKTSTDVRVLQNVTSGIDAPLTATIEENYILAAEVFLRTADLQQQFTGNSFDGVLADESFKVRIGSTLDKRHLGSSLTHR